MIQLYRRGQLPLDHILARHEPQEELSQAVADIIASVRRKGDSALLRYARQFDGAAPQRLEVPPEELERALEELENYKEVNLFLRGIVPMIGFKTDVVTYERHKRFAGESKYPLKKMLSFATDGITSFSIKPIRMITVFGFFIFVVSLIMLVYSLVVHSMGHTVWGWTSTIVSIWAIGGLQLLAIGVVGEYIGKIYLETKNRPKYIIEKVLEE